MTKKHKSVSKRSSAIFSPFPVGIFVFLTTFSIYCLTLNPALFRNDSPETITACCTLGVSHPPSYPLHTLLGRLFMLITIGNPAMTLNFFSTFLGSLGVIFFTINLWLFLNRAAFKTDRKMDPISVAVVCVVGSLCLAFSKSYWSASLAAKGGIYSLQVVLELALLSCFQYLIQNTSTKKGAGFPNALYLLIFIFSLGLVNHWPSFMLLVPAIVLLVFIYQSFDPSKSFFYFGSKQILFALTILCLILSLYLYLPIRANLHPVLNFGNPSSFRRFSDSISRADYFKRETLASFISTALQTIEGKASYISGRFRAEFSDIFSAFAVLGLFLLWRLNRKLEMLFFLVVLLTTLVSNLVYLQVSPIEYWHMDDHLLTINWVTALLASVGLYHAVGFVVSRGLLKYIFWGFLTFLPFLTLQKSLAVNNQTREFLYQGYGMEALKSMGPNAKYFAESDYDYFSILYLREIGHKRPDIDLKMTTFLTDGDWFTLAREVSSKSSLISHSIYCAFPNGNFINDYLRHATTASFSPSGTIVEFMPPMTSKKNAPVLQPLEELWERFLSPERRSANPINGLLLELCAHPYLNMGNYLKLRGDLREWDSFYEKALSLIQDPKWSAETSATKAEGDLALKDKTTVLVDYLFAFQQYKKAGMPIQAEEIWQKTLAMQPSIRQTAHKK